MRVIMVPVADRPECVPTLETAFALAERLGSNVIGCHVRPHREERHTSHGARLALTLEEGRLPDLPEATIRLNSANARRVFGEIARRWNAPMARKPRVAEHTLAYWREMVGTPEKVLGIVGPTVDCTVVSRPKARSSGPARAFMLAALLRTGKPLMVLPQKRIPTPGKRVTIAWDQGALAASAVTAALPILARAEQVHIVCCGLESDPGPKMAQLRSYLLHWGIESDCGREKGRKPADEIIKTFKATRSDLLVMGAYSRGRLRERILGGVTHAMLMHTDLPVFALHS